MSTTRSSAAHPVPATFLTTLPRSLRKTQVNAVAGKFSAKVLAESGKAPNMQQQLPASPLHIAKTLTLLETLPANAFEGREARERTFPMGKKATGTLEAFSRCTSISPRPVPCCARRGDSGKGDCLVGEQILA